GEAPRSQGRAAARGPGRAGRHRSGRFGGRGGSLRADRPARRHVHRPGSRDARRRPARGNGGGRGGRVGGRRVEGAIVGSRSRGGGALVGTVRRGGAPAAARVEAVFSMDVMGRGARTMKGFVYRLLEPPSATTTPSATAKAGADGRFVLEGLGAGIYDVIATAE